MLEVGLLLILLYFYYGSFYKARTHKNANIAL